MKTVFVIDRTQDWPFELPGSTVVAARSYLAEATGGGGDVQVINLCRADRYQGRGYYVSLLAEARGHRPLPDVKTVEDLKSDEQVQAVAQAVGELASETLHHDESDRFELDAYFGRDPAERHQPLAEQLFAQVRAPLLRTRFRRDGGRWSLEKIAAIGVADVPAQHRAFLVEAAKAFVGGSENPRDARRGGGAKPKVAILWDPAEEHKPSNEAAICASSPPHRRSASSPRSSGRTRSSACPSLTASSSAAAPTSPAIRTSSRAAPSRSACRSSTTRTRSSSARTRSTCAS